VHMYIYYLRTSYPQQIYNNLTRNRLSILTQLNGTTVIKEAPPPLPSHANIFIIYI
jgi:hypothetical protein